MLVEEIILKNLAMQRELELAKHTEQHLKSAENALQEKDKTIQEWKKSYTAVVERNGMLRKVLDKRDAEIAQLKEKAAKYSPAEIQGMSQEIRVLRHLCDEYNKEKADLQMQVNVLLAQVDKYRAALKDLEGTFCARADHDKEVADHIHKLIAPNA